MNSLKDLENAASGTQVDLSGFLGWVSFNEQGWCPRLLNPPPVRADAGLDEPRGH